MGKELSFSDLDLSFVPATVQSDEYWKCCIRLALTSKSKNQRYGAIAITQEGELIGSGRNRLLERGEYCPFRTSFFLHAEADAIRDAALQRGKANLKGVHLYIAGLLPKERRPLIRRSSMLNKGSCVSCARLYVRYGISPCPITEVGWRRLSAEQSLLNAQTTAAMIRNVGMDKREFRKSICL